MIERLRQILTPRASQVGLLLILVGAAVLLADSEGGRQIADDAAVQIRAEAVLSAAAVTESAARQAVVVARGWQGGVAGIAEVDRAEASLRGHLSDLDLRVEALAPLLQGDPDLLSAHDRFHTRAEAIADALGSRDIERAAEANESLTDAYEEMKTIAVAIRDERTAHIDTVREGIGTVATAARLMVGLVIPALVILFVYRGLRQRQKRVLLAAKLERETALRKKQDQFLAGASHHLNTPLAAVLGFAELLRDRARDFNAGLKNELIELMVIQATEASHVAEDVLIAARSNMDELTLQAEEVSLREAVETVTGDWERAQLARLRVSGNAVARADSKRVSQIVRNLLRNAVAFGGENITVSITAGFNRTVLEVIDDGEGVPEGQEERIFQPYYSLRQIEGLAPSLGLGLSVGRRLARAMGGDLSYRREDGNSVFELWLPEAADILPAPEVPDLTIGLSRETPKAHDVSQVVDRGGPQMAYQPIVDMRASSRGEGVTIGYEGLARFPFSSPLDWFKSARSEGMGLDLELSCIRAAIQQFGPENEDQFLVVNISGDTLTSSRLPEALDGIDTGRLVLELSERTVINSYEATRGAIEVLGGKGVRLSIDDIGAVEIDLWHIVRLKASVLKIDISLVREVDQSATCRSLIRAIVAMAEELGSLVVAEGVETEVEQSQLLNLGVQYGQGYLYGKPEPLQWPARVLSG